MGTKMDIKELIQALQDVIDATKAHDDAFDKFEGYSWDYFGSDYIKDKKDAQDQFEKAIEEYIDLKIEAALIKKDKNENRG